MFQLMYFVKVFDGQISLVDVLSLCSISNRAAFLDMHGFQDMVKGVSNSVVNVTTTLVLVFMTIINKSLDS